MAFWSNQRVLVTGGSGFLGRHVIEALRKAGAQELHAPSRAAYDLTARDEVLRVMRDTRPTMVIHLAARVGGIGANQAEPGSFFYQNAVMGIELMEQARLHGVEKFVALGTVCAYPKYAPIPFREEDLWNGYPEETNAPYGLAKKMLLVQSQAYRAQYGFNSIYLLPVNLYGPGDNFDPSSSHVIPAMIRKFVEAHDKNLKHVVLWGTGRPTREFLFVRDAATGIVQASEHYNRGDPVNLGSAFEISIRELAHEISTLVGFRGEIVWDKSRPDGQPRRKLDVEKAARLFGFRSITDFHAGLAETIVCYRASLLR